MSFVCRWCVFSRVDVTRARGFGLLQPVLGLTRRGVSLGGGFSIPKYELFEWV